MLKLEPIGPPAERRVSRRSLLWRGRRSHSQQTDGSARARRDSPSILPLLQQHDPLTVYAGDKLVGLPFRHDQTSFWRYIADSGWYPGQREHMCPGGDRSIIGAVEVDQCHLHAVVPQHGGRFTQREVSRDHQAAGIRAGDWGGRGLGGDPTITASDVDTRTATTALRLTTKHIFFMRDTATKNTGVSIISTARNAAK